MAWPWMSVAVFNRLEFLQDLLSPQVLSAGISARKLMVRMKACDLNGTTQAEFSNQSFRDAEEIIVVEEIPENVRVDKQRGFETRARG